MCQIFVIQISKRVERDSCMYVIKIFLNLNSLGNKNLELFSQATYDFQNFGKKTLFIAYGESVKKSAFDWLAAKLCLKESTFL